MYRFLYNCVFCLAFINFLIYWINLFFSKSQASVFNDFQSGRNVLVKDSSSNLEKFSVKENRFYGTSNVSDLLKPWTETQTPTGADKINNNSYSIQENTISYIEPKNRLFGQWPKLLVFNWLSQAWNITQLKYFTSSFISSSLLWFALTLLIFFRIIQCNHFPLANFYEALIFLTWCLVSLNFLILLEPTGKKKSVNSVVSPKGILTWLPFPQITSFYEEQSVQKQVSGAILAPIILFIIAFAQFHLSSDVTPLVPALKSNWLLMHVSIMICSYTTFIIGGLLSLILLTQMLFSGTVTSFFRARRAGGFNKSWSRWRHGYSINEISGPKMLFMSYPMFGSPPIASQSMKCLEPGKNTRSATPIKVGWPSLSQFSYVNNEIRSEDAFLKMQNQMWRETQSERVLKPFWFNALNQKNVHAFQDILKQKVAKRENFTDHYFSGSKPFYPGFLSRFATLSKENKMSEAIGSNPKPLENVKSTETTERSLRGKIGQPNLQSNWGFPSFEHVLEGPYKMQKKNFYIILDNLSYRMIGIGFPLFTLGILSGAVWANEAWGSYWSWDIKEVGSFINWLLVALYFHCRYKNFISLSHIVSFVSLLVLFFNFFGISLGIFGSSLHAYGASS